MLEIKNVYKTFNAGTVNEKVALKGLDLTLEDGDFVTVIGGNGAGNTYGHPTQEVLDRLEERGIEVRRTDESGTIIIKVEK